MGNKVIVLSVGDQTKESKAAAGYATDGPFLCGRCRHFDRVNACELVAGQIEFVDCCNLFQHRDGL